MIYELYLSMADHAVCNECLSHHARVYPRGSGPQPPLHPGCRCSREFYYTSQSDEPPPPLPYTDPAWWFINDQHDPRPHSKPSPKDPWDSLINWWDNLIRPDKKRGKQ